MDFLDLIGTVIEFSQKGEELSDEIKSINTTFLTLKCTLENLDKRE